MGAHQPRPGPDPARPAADVHPVTATDADPTAHIDFARVQADGRFRELRRTHRSFVFPMAAAFLVWYFLYVLLADYAHGFMATRLVGNITVGLVLGLLQFVTTFAITMGYVAYANRRLDPLATELREDLEGADSAFHRPAASADHPGPEPTFDGDVDGLAHEDAAGTGRTATGHGPTTGAASRTEGDEQ